MKHNCAHEYEQEKIEAAERQAHDDGLCNTVTCIYCIEDREEAEREEADREAYYDWWGRWTL